MLPKPRESLRVEIHPVKDFWSTWTIWENLVLNTPNHETGYTKKLSIQNLHLMTVYCEAQKPYEGGIILAWFCLGDLSTLGKLSLSPQNHG